MNEELKILAAKICNTISKKVKNASIKELYKFKNNMGLGADGTITKYIDKYAEDIAIDIIKKSKLKINLLSEEIGFIDNKAEYTFVLDPVDGTRNAYRGIPFYSVSLAIGKKNLNDIEYGIVKNISTDDEYIAEKKLGAFFNKKQIIVPEVPDKEILASLTLGNNCDRLTLNLAKKDKVRSLGCASLEMCLVATGGLDFFMLECEYIRITDIAASALFLREAGGVLTDINGKNLDMSFDLHDRKSFIAACNKQIIEEIIS